MKNVTDCIIGILFIIFIKNVFKNFLYLTRKYRQLWIRDYVHIIFNSFKFTVEDIKYILRFIVKLNNKIFILIKKIQQLRIRIKYKVSSRGVEYDRNKIVAKIRNLSPREFEIFCANLYKLMGYKVKLTAPTCDGGKDIILWDVTGKKIYVECKHYNKNGYVGREICQKLLGACIMDKAKEAIVITTGKFNQNAYEVSKKVGNLTLVDMEEILNKIKKFDSKGLAYMFEFSE